MGWSERKRCAILQLCNRHGYSQVVREWRKICCYGTVTYGMRT